ncbi:MAG TPA: alpha/beta hydrolase [Spongiibacteraceae bacterium]|jgi:pimeloyl-ACP methyl ester carboxylesterase|nr:alpha/beta hydrolase [Spongiibacteraceae bacterium]HUH39188.1 alpha/beta hydrolase [Spongiibacteraceae bacterium]
MTATQHLRVNGVNWAWREAGRGPLVVCLHGFPDTAHSFDELLPVLAEAGYRAVSVFLPGYSPSGPMPGDDYTISSIARQVLALIEALGERRAILVGHDWGGMIACCAANIAPQTVSRLVVLAVPHLGATRFSLAQLRKSWYVWFFQLPWWPERAVARNNYAFIDRLYAAWSPGWDPAQWQLTPVKHALAAPGGLRAALAYYRAMIRGNNRANFALMAAPTPVPSLWFAGAEDGSVDCRQFDGMQQAFTGPFKQVTVPGAGHFVHREAAQLFQSELIKFLAADFSGEDQRND